jgi:hypothetical protein
MFGEVDFFVVEIFLYVYVSPRCQGRAAGQGVGRGWGNAITPL